MVRLGTGFDGSGSVNIRALFRRIPLGNGLMGQTAIGAGNHYVAKIHVAGGGQHIHAIVAALHVGSAGDVVPIQIKDSLKISSA